jgi:Protein of unknown function (DUF1622)
MAPCLATQQAKDPSKSTTTRDAYYRPVRTVFGRSILLGLEFLVAADIIRTIAVEPSLENVGVLGLIVLIRTFLSFSLEVEIDGVWPWRRAALAQGPSLPSHSPNGPEQQ